MSIRKRKQNRSAAASRNPRAVLSATPDLFKFVTTGEGLKVVQK